MNKAPFDEGIFAFETAKRRSANPYSQGSEDYVHWNNGYDYAADNADEF